MDCILSKMSKAKNIYMEEKIYNLYGFQWKHLFIMNIINNVLRYIIYGIVYDKPMIFIEKHETYFFPDTSFGLSKVIWHFC